MTRLGPKLDAPDLRMTEDYVSEKDGVPLFKKGSMFICRKKDRWMGARCPECHGGCEGVS